MTARLALRPDLDQNIDALPLYVKGALVNAKPALAYEGRLKIHNASGRCTVFVLPGSDALPPGSSVFVDHATQEVVVAWPPYSEYVTPLQNPGFEVGDTSGWSFVMRGGSATPTVDASQRYEGAKSLKWPGGQGMGSEGGIELEAWNNTIGPCLPGRRVTTHLRCMYNPAGHNFGCRYQALVRFVDGAGNPIGTPSRGRVFKGRFNNRRWSDANVSATAPAGTAGVQLGGWLTGSKAPVWMDAASWDVPSSLGTNTVGVINLVLRVRDSAGRTALWFGLVKVESSDPIAVAILAKLSSFWPFDNVTTGVVDGTQLDAVGTQHATTVNGGVKPAAIAARTAGRQTPKMSASTHQFAAPSSPYPVGQDWCSFGWFYFDGDGAAASALIMSHWNASSSSTTAGFYLQKRIADLFIYNVGRSSGALVKTIPNSSAPNGQWHFFISQRVAGKWQCYMDGVAVGTFDTDISEMNDSVGHPRYFGCAGPYFQLDGRLQDLGWCVGSSLTPDEVDWLYNGGVGRTIEQIRSAAGV